jgi:sugar phosphate isomerase/epimerase
MKPQLALQLYTLRAALAQDFGGTLRRIADIGYRFVESAFWPAGVTRDGAAAQIRHAGLTVMAAHCELPLGAGVQPMLDTVAALGCTRVIWHGWPQDPDYTSIEGIHRLAERYNAANAVARQHGLTLGLHNHWWEIERVEGQRPYQILLAELDPTIFFEVDTYWVKTAGADPVQVVTELGRRAPLLHIKDGPAVQGAPMTAVGDGTLDFPAILAASNGAAEWLIVELDECATDMFTAVERSYRYLTEQQLVDDSPKEPPHEPGT